MVLAVVTQHPRYYRGNLDEFRVMYIRSSRFRFYGTTAAVEIKVARMATDFLVLMCCE